jgi:hypothetical protein
VHEHLPSGYTHACAPALTRSSQAPLAFANDAGQGASAAQARAAHRMIKHPTPKRFIEDVCISAVS